MSDFHQQGVIADLHRLHETLDGESYLLALEGELEKFAQQARMALILPVHISDFRCGKALPKIVAEISKVRYLHKILIALGGVERLRDFQAAKDYFGRLRTAAGDVKVIWVDGPRIQSVLRSLQDQNMSIGASGKGQSVWIALGYLFAQNGWGKDAGAFQTALLPSWEKVASTIPHIQSELVKAVMEDNFLPRYFPKRQDQLSNANQPNTIGFHNGKI